MNKELALRTFAYLIRHYKTHNATIINSQEIEAIEFILNDNEFLEQQCKKQKECIDKLKEYISSQMISYDDGEDCGVDCECDGFKLLDILKEVG